MAISNLGAGNIRSSDPQAVDYYKKIDSRLNTQKSEQTGKSKEIFSKTLDKVSANTLAKKVPLTSAKTQIDNHLKTVKDSKSLEKSAGESNGTDLAREEEVATELVNQVYGFLWNEMAKEVNKKPEGGFGEKMFQGSLWPELVKNASGKDMDVIKKAIVRDLKENRNVGRK